MWAAANRGRASEVQTWLPIAVVHQILSTPSLQFGRERPRTALCFVMY
jgi:hypothetical protein